MPLPRGSDPEQAAIGYVNALDGYPIEAIAYGIRKFLRGECEGISQKFCPHPPELAAIVRSVVPQRQTFKTTGKLYGYKPPKSQIIHRKITKDEAWRLLDMAAYPVGSIWCPGPIDDKPEVGDLYGPDPDWKRAVPLSVGV